MRVAPSSAARELRPVCPELRAYLERCLEGGALRLNPPQMCLCWLGNTVTVVLHREGQFQVELVALAPGAAVPTHEHPDVDSFELALGGQLEFFVDGKQAGFFRSPRADGAARELGRYVPVAADAPHGGRAGELGACFLSVQRWREGVRPGFVALNWRGKPLSAEHAGALA